MRSAARRLVDATYAAGAAVVRSRLFRKYAVLFVAVVCSALIANSLVELWFSYQDYKTLLVRTQREQAAAAAEKIGQFIEGVKNEIGWMTQVPWSKYSRDEQYLDALRLLRQVPAIIEVVQLDPAGHEYLRVSRLVMDVDGSGLDLSRDPRFTEALAHKVYYGPAYFRRDSEPYMTIALVGALRDSGVSVVEVNLKLIWDVISKIKVGKRGYAYVVDSAGRLIAHPDIDLVLRNTNLSHLAQVQAAMARVSIGLGEQVQVAKDPQGQEVLTAYAPIAPLGWSVFIDLPTEEAYAPLHASVLRSGVVLLAGLALAVFAGLFLARRMVVPIQVLCKGATRIGSGDFEQRMSIKTGDELEVLGEQFNRMAAHLQDSYANLERKVEERTHQLEAANLSKSRFIAAASHDLRQPLQALGLFVAQLRGRVNARERQGIVERVGTAVGEMNELFNALLDISKLDAGVVAPNFAEFPISRLLQRLETTFTGAAYEQGLRLRVVSSDAWVRSDKILLERILLNVVSNAIRYTADGGVIVGCRRRGGRLRIEVWDSGPGIPEDQRHKIFDEFYQIAKPERNQAGAIGLGLAIVDRLCRLLDHPIELTSFLGKGSRFTIIVPIAAPQFLNEASIPRQGAIDAVTGKTVVVVDDAALVLEGMSGLLRKWGFRVLAAQSCKQALAQLAEGGERPDLVVSDYHLPDGETGIEVIDRMRDAFGMPIPAFLVSGDTSPERLREAHAKGYYLLHKPVSPMRLRAVLNQVLNDHSEQRIEKDDDSYSIAQLSGISPSSPFAQP
jgi:signal transduction histidine kinase/FixJ family two-component response regulator